MIISFEKETSGVLLLCSKKGLQKYYADNEFNYDFPEGILPLINEGIILAVVTESGEDVVGQVRISESLNDDHDYLPTIENKFILDADDEIFLLSHAEFTQICDSHKGDITAFSFWDEKISIDNVKEGWYSVRTYYKTSEEMPYLDIIFDFTFAEAEPVLDEATKLVAGGRQFYWQFLVLVSFFILATTLRKMRLICKN